MMRRSTIEWARSLASAKGGKLLTTEYANNKTNMLWQCEAGHEWWATASSINTGTWCRACWNSNSAGKHLVLQDGLEQARTIAEKRGGECLSSEYISGTTPMHWRCANGHEWSALFTDIKKRSWCPSCQPWVRERICRDIVEQLYQQPFPKKRPQWMRTSGYSGLELDGLNEDLRVAFEHHGAHHYEHVAHFQRREESLANRQAVDQVKRELCRERGVILIEIPHWISISEMPSWIANALVDAGAPQTAIDATSVVLRDNVTDQSLEKLKAVAAERGGECLSTAWYGAMAKHRFRCDDGHEWEATASNVLTRTWCPGCKNARIAKSNFDPAGFERMERIAASKNGQFLSKEYLGVNVRHRWACEKGHEWEAAPADVVRRTWCRICRINEARDDIVTMHRLAEARGGHCLSTEYTNQQSKILWQCAHGHQWRARAANVKNSNAWCPTCSAERRGMKRRQ